MMDLFARLREGSGVATVMVTHSEEEARRLATRIVRLGGHPATILDERRNVGPHRHGPAPGLASTGP